MKRKQSTAGLLLWGILCWAGLMANGFAQSWWIEGGDGYGITIGNVYYSMRNWSSGSSSLPSECSASRASTSISGHVSIPSSISVTFYYDEKVGTNWVHHTTTKSISVVYVVNFSGCPSLTGVSIPSSVTTIGEWAFQNCTSLSSVSLPSSITVIPNSMFSGCSSLRSVTIPSSVREIGGYAFWECSSLSSVTIPNSVTTIGNSAFGKCDSLTSVTIGTGVKTIGDSAFRNCPSLPSLVIPNNVVSVGDYMLSGSVGLETVSIGHGVTNIPMGLFSGLTNLVSVSIGNGVKVLHASSFSGCRRLQSVTLGSSIQEIANETFNRCNSLQSIVIPDSVTRIGDSAFASCGSLASVVFGSGLQEIERSAFELCTSLTSLSFPSALRVIGDHAFQSCRNLAEVGFQGSGIQSIGVGAFENCVSLNEVVLPASLNQMGNMAFATGAQRTDLYFKGNAPQGVAVSGMGTLSTGGSGSAKVFGSSTPGILYRTRNAAGFPAEGAEIQPGHPVVLWEDAEIDVLLLFDKNAEAWVEENAAGDLQSVAQGYITQLNQSMADSGAGAVTFRVAAAKSVDYETTDKTLTTPLNDLKSYNGALSVASGWREETSADLVTLIVGGLSGAGITSGKGNVASSLMGHPNSGCFSVCVVQAIEPYDTLGHEIGHNLGLQHAHQMETPSGHIADYGAGWYFKGDQDFHTIMAYNTLGNKSYTRTSLFSNPVKQHRGGAAGDKDKGDAVRLIKQMAPVVAKYRTANVPVQLPAGLSALEAEVASQWILANPEWGTDFRHVSAKSLMAGYLVNEPPRAFLDEEVEFSIAESAAGDASVQMTVDLMVEQTPKTGPVNARMDIESRTSLLPGSLPGVVASYTGPAFVSGRFPVEAAATNDVMFFYPVLRLP